MGIGFHPIGGPCRLKRINHAGTVQTDIQIDRLGRFKKTVEMLIKKNPGTIVKPKPFLRTIT